jgi:hypothetical protein
MRGSDLLLSLVVCGKNDHYQGNFIFRLASSLNFGAKQLEKLGKLDKVEWIVTDWSSDEPLSSALELNEAARKVCRFLYVPKEITKSLYPDGKFAASVALNAGLRRARGEFCAMYDADSLLPAFSFESLFRLLEGKTVVDPKNNFFFLNRHQIPWEVVQQKHNEESWERYLLLHGGGLTADASGFGLGSAGSGHMAHRNLWKQLQGYDEQLTDYGWGDIELCLRATQEVPMINLAGLGVHAYHMEHWPRNRRTQNHRASNCFIINSSVTVNDGNWGLGKYEIPFQEASKPISKISQPSLPLPDKSKLVENINSKEVREHVELYLKQVADLMQLEEVAGLAKPELNLEALFILTWYGLTYMPKVVLNFGVQNAHELAVLGRACWGVEFYLIHNWIESKEKIWSPVALIASLLECAGYKGYVRYLTGDTRTAMERFRKSPLSPHQIDIGMVYDWANPVETANFAKEFYENLSPNGLLLLQAETPERIKELLADPRLQELQPHVVLAGSGKNVMVFKPVP